MRRAAHTKTLFRHLAPRCAVLALALLWLALATPPAAAQSALDYGRLLEGRGGSQAEPLQSRPVRPPPSGTADTAPSAADYGRIASDPAVAESAAGSSLSRVRQSIGLFRARLRSLVMRTPEALDRIQIALAAASPTGEPIYFLGVSLFAALLIVIGRTITMIYMVYLVRRFLLSLQSTERHGYRGKLPVLAWRMFFTLIGVAITLSVASGVGLIFYQEHEATLLTVLVVFGTYGVLIGVDTLWRMAIAPYFPEYRLPAISDRRARNLYRWVSAMSCFAILSMAFAYWMQLLGLAAEVHTILIVVLSFATLLGVLAIIWIHRRTISTAILSGQPREEASWLTLAAVTVWAPLTVLYLLITWTDLSFRMVMGIETSPLRLAVPYAIFMAGIVVYAVAAYLIERVFGQSREIEALNAELEAHSAAEDAAADGVAPAPELPDEEAPAPVVHRRHSMQSFEDLARRMASIFAIGAVGWALIRFWGGPGVFERIPGLDILSGLTDTLLIGYVIYHAVRIWIDRRISEEVGDEEPVLPGEGEGGGAGATRLATLLPLVRNFLLISIAVGTILLVAVELGVNVAPLFAGAGVVGLAIGFGSQALVRDILSGAFFLLDDAFRKGEYIDVGEVKGTVEKISLRSFQLRHHLGMLHTIPFGEIQYLTNFSRDWVMMKLPLRLTYDTDPEKVRKLVKKLGLALLEDPEIGDKFIQPVKSQGVIQMDDSAMIVRIKFMTRPGEQWVLRKRIYAEIRELFAREGIKFAHREVTVRVPGLEDRKEDLTEEEVRAIGAGAKRAVDQVEEEMVPAAAKR